MHVCGNIQKLWRQYVTNQVPFDLRWPATKFCLLLAGTTSGNSFRHILPERLFRGEYMHMYIHRWASLVVQMVKNLPTMQKTQVRSLGLEDTLEKGNGYPLQHSCLENSMNGGAWQATVHGLVKSQTWLSDSAHIHKCVCVCVYMYIYKYTNYY